MQFFSDRFGQQYPVSSIKRIGIPSKRPADAKPPYPAQYYDVELSDGDIISVESYVVDTITEAPLRMIPALPDTFLMSEVDTGDGDVSDVWLTPVIAWGFGADGLVRPWTPDGPDDGNSTPRPILMPNGIVIAQGDRSYRSVEEWFDLELSLKQNAASKPTAAKEDMPRTPKGASDVPSTFPAPSGSADQESG